MDTISGRTIWSITDLSELEQLALDIKAHFVDRQDPERARLLGVLNSRRECLKATARWMAEPDRIPMAEMAKLMEYLEWGD